MRAVVATHGHCFDGLCSAVVFTRLLRELKGRELNGRELNGRELEGRELDGRGIAGRESGGRELPGATMRFHYLSCGYSPSQRALSELLDGDVNAILDYRFCATDRLDWYFDHHRTAFGSDADQAFYAARRDHRPYYYDASYSSCTKLVRDIALDRYGVAMPELEPLTAWADKIDSAAFESAEAALDYSDPVMQLVSVVEHHGDGELIARLVPRLLEAPVEAVARRSEFRQLYRKIRRKKAAFAKRVRQNARHRGRVVLVDLSEAELETYGKFVTYALYPDAMYSVILGRFKNGARINVGYNPWSARELDRDLSSICGRYGGGGHPFVGGISFPAEDVHRAQNVAHEIARELDG